MRHNLDLIIQTIAAIVGLAAIAFWIVSTLISRCS